MKIAVSESLQRQVLPNGAYPALCYGYIELGTIQTKYGHKPVIQFLFETPNNKAVFEGPFEEPFKLIVECTASLVEGSNLRKYVEGWTGKALEVGTDFDPASLLGTPCMVLLEEYTTQDGKQANRVLSMSIYNGNTLKGEIKPIQFEIGAWTEEQVNGLPDFIKRKVISSQEYMASTGKLDVKPLVPDAS